jgi:hypothetical protein
MSLFFNFPTWMVAAVFGVLLLLATELGFRLGKATARRENADAKSAGGVVKNAVLALAGLVLAFSYAMAAGRYDLRNQVLLREANGLGTCWLRTDFLPEAPRERSRVIMREFVDTRLRLFDTALEPGRYAAENKELDRLGGELWRLVSDEFNKAEQPFKLALLVAAVNEVIDANGARAAAIHNRVPPPVTMLLLMCVTFSLFLTGHSSGMAGHRQWLLWCVMIILMVAVFTLAEDLDRPRRGLIQLNHAPLIELRASMGP